MCTGMWYNCWALCGTKYRIAKLQVFTRSSETCSRWYEDYFCNGRTITQTSSITLYPQGAALRNLSSTVLLSCALSRIGHRHVDSNLRSWLHLLLLSSLFIPAIFIYRTADQVAPRFLRELPLTFHVACWTLVKCSWTYFIGKHTLPKCTASHVCLFKRPF